MKKITLILALLVTFVTNWSYGQGPVSQYSFSQSAGTYIAITGGTVLGSTATDDDRFVDPAVPAGGTTATGVGFPIGFNFNYNGYVYDRFAINANGWISFGTSTLTPSVNLTSTSSYNPLSSTSTTVSNDLVARVAAIGRDLQAQTGADLRYELSGVAPNQALTIQWTNFRKYNVTGDSYSFQIKLYETTNVVQVVYGTVTNNATSTPVQCGLRANPNSPASNFNSRTSTTSWSATTASTLASNSVTLSSTVFPASGLTFSWTPPVACSGTPVAGSVTPVLQNLCSGSTPANLVATGYSSGVTGLTFQWEESDDDGVTDAWANAVGGTGATTATYTPPAFSGTTIYYRLNVTCSNSASSAQTTSVMVAPPANPTTQVTNANATNVLTTSANINWTNGNGSRRLVILSDSATIIDPVNGSAPAIVANTVYAGTGQQIIYDGTATTVNVTGLSATTTYYVHVYEYLRCGAGPYDYYFNTTLGTNVMSFTTIAPPVNDNCSGATALTVGENFAANPLAGTILAATTTSGITPSCQASFGSDVWYTVVVPASGNVTIETQVAATNSMTDSVVAVFTGACGTLNQIGCDDDNGVGTMSLLNITGQTPGTTLYVGVWKFGTTAPTTAASNFIVSAYDCPSATPAPTGNAAQSFCTSATVADLVATGTAIKWYTTMTGGTAMATTDALTTGTTYYASQTINCESFARLAVTVTIDTVPADPTGNAAQTYCSTINGTLSALSVTGSGIVWYDAATAGSVLPTSTTLVAGTTYYAEATSGTCVSAGRLAVTVSEFCPCLTSPNGQWPTTTYTPATCDGSTSNSVTTCGYAGEYSVVNVTSGQTYTFSSSVTTDIISISTDNGATAVAFGTGSVTWVSTVTGTIRFYTHLTGCASDTTCRTRSVICGTPPTTVPDCPTLVSPADLSVDLGTSVTLSWTAPTTGSSVSSYNIYIDTTNPPTTLVGNVTGLTGTINNLSPSTTYYWMVNSVNVVGQSTGCTVYSFTTVAPPANDLCSGASALTVGENFATNPVAGTIFGATTTAGITPSCQSSISSDVWYTVVVPASGNVTIETQGAATNSMTDSVVAVFTGACGTLTQIGCDDDTGVGTMSLLNITGQTPGTTLYIGVWKWQTSAATATTGNFIVSAYDCPSATPAPTGSAAQTFCVSATVADLVATGTAIKWYTAATGGTALTSTTALTSGTTYYASQTINCESFGRLAVTVTINPQVTPAFAAIAPLCIGSTAPSLDATSTNAITGTWSPATIDTSAAGTITYTFTPDAGQCATTTSIDVVVNAQVTTTFAAVSPICAGSTAPTLPTTSTNGVTGTWSPATVDNMATATYTFTPDAGQCATTATLDVTVNTTAAPTGASAQTFCAGELVSMIDVTGTSVVWYTDATGTTVVNGSTPIVDGTTYYAAQTLGGCESTSRLAVTMTLGSCLGIAAFDDAAFNFYPNPIKDVLNISYSNTIDSVEVISLTGQQIFVKNFNSSEIKLDMNNLPTGTYMLNITSGDKVKTIKVIKQ